MYKRQVYDLVGKADEDTLYQPGASEAEAAAARKVLLRERHRVVGKVVDDFDRNNFNTCLLYTSPEHRPDQDWRSVP